MRVDEEVQPCVLDAKQLTDDALIVRLKRCVAQDRQLTARLLEHLGELDARGLYRDQGYPSMFHYAVHSLRMSEDEAGLRIWLARFGRKFPEALQILARGELHMTALRLLAPVLTHDNVGLLHEARFKTKRQVLELLAKHFPKSDVPAQNRKLPSRPLAGSVRPAVDQSRPSELVKASSYRDAVATHAPASAGTAPAPDASVVPADAPSSDARATSAGLVDREASVVGSLGFVQDAGHDNDGHRELAAADDATKLRHASSPGCVDGAASAGGSLRFVHDASQANDEHREFAAAGEGAQIRPASSPECVGGAASAGGSLERVRAAGQNEDAHRERAATGEAAQLRPAATRADATAEFRLESPARAVVIPLSEGRYLVRFTADQPMQDKLTQAQELMRHEVRRGDFVTVIDRALDLLIAERKKKLFGLRTKPRSSRAAVPVARTEGGSANNVAQAPAATVPVSADEAVVPPGESNGSHTLELDEVSTERMRESDAPAQGRSPRSKHIPRAVRREVMARDGFQCTFMGPEGNRCPERGRLQLDHYPVPEACGGPATTGNLRVCCAAHNLLAAEQFYGRDKVLHEIAAARARVSVSKSESLHVPERAAVDVGSPRRETTRTLRADSRSRPESEGPGGRTRIARSSA